jgi:hypothetical protein
VVAPNNSAVYLLKKRSDASSVHFLLQLRWKEWQLRENSKVFKQQKITGYRTLKISKATFATAGGCRDLRQKA